MAQAYGREARAQRRCLLVVEDDPAIADLLKAIVEDAGCEAIWAADGSSALRLAHELQPRLITLDLGLPGLDGRAVLRALSADPATAHIAVVVISAYVHTLPADERRAAAGVIQKPFDVDEVIRAIDGILRAA